jgi:ElaB/YqjD/DUF883 family membrane-anchored ribosome-binding protein
MRRIYNFFRRLRVSQALLVVAVALVLVLGTACSPSPSSSSAADPPRTVDKSASPGQDVSDSAKQQLIEKAKRQQPTNPIDSVSSALKGTGEKAENFSDDVSRSAKDLAKKSQRSLEDASDAVEDQASNAIKGTQRTIDKAAS